MMEKKQSCCCSGFPKGLWWLISLLGLGLIYFLMFNGNKDLIESELSDHASDTLSSEGMAWASVDVDGRGRDVLLSGQAPSGVDKTKAINLVQNIVGVRVVEDNITVGGDGDAGATAATEGSDTTTTAALATAIAGATLAANGSADANDAVSTDVDTGTTADAGSDVDATVSTDADVSVDDADVDTTTSTDAADVNTVGADANTDAGEATAVISLSISSDDANKLVLEGAVASEEERDAIYQAAIAKVGESQVINNLKVDSTVKPSLWLSNISDLVSLITEGGSLEADASGVKFTGSVSEQSAMDHVIQTANNLLSTAGIPVLNNLLVENVKETGMNVASTVVDVEISETLVATPITQVEIETEEEAAIAQAAEAQEKAAEDQAQAEAEAQAKAEAKAKAEAEAQAKAEAKAQAKAEAKAKEKAAKEAKLASASAKCQADLNGAMVNKTIHFRTNSATIKVDSLGLLSTIADVMKSCSTQISAKGVTINGHTDSRGAESYNMGLSNRRAESVKRYLVKLGVNTSHLKSVGHGELQPIADNATPEGRAQNRRITFIINNH